MWRGVGVDEKLLIGRGAMTRDKTALVGLAWISKLSTWT